MSRAKSNRLAIDGMSAQVFADCMLGIANAVCQCDYWLAHIMGRP